MSMNESYTNEWTPRAHRLINEWKEKAQGYAWMHTQSSKIFQHWYILISLPPVLLSTVTSTDSIASFVVDTSQILPQWLQITVNAFSIVILLFNALQAFLNFKDRQSLHAQLAKQFLTLASKIQQELIMEPAKRTPCTIFFQYVSNEYNKLLEADAAIPLIVSWRYSLFLKSMHKHGKRVAVPDIIWPEVYNERMLSTPTPPWSTNTGNSNNNNSSIVAQSTPPQADDSISIETQHIQQEVAIEHAEHQQQQQPIAETRVDIENENTLQQLSHDRPIQMVGHVQQQHVPQNEMVDQNQLQLSGKIQKQTTFDNPNNVDMKILQQYRFGTPTPAVVVVNNQPQPPRNLFQRILASGRSLMNTINRGQHFGSEESATLRQQQPVAGNTQQQPTNQNNLPLTQRVTSLSSIRSNGIMREDGTDLMLTFMHGARRPSLTDSTVPTMQNSAQIWSPAMPSQSQSASSRTTAVSSPKQQTTQ